MDLSEIIEQRKAKLSILKEKGVPAYPSIPSGRIDIGEILKDFSEGKKVAICGRIMAKRQHGKAVFMDLKDESARIQLYIKIDFVGEDLFSLLDNVDIADILCVRGELFKTHTGEPTIKAEEFKIIAKALRPLPEKWHG